MKQLSKEHTEYAVGRLHQLVQHRGYSQPQLEQLSRVNQSTISKIFARTLNPSEANLKKLFQAVGLRLEDILNETDAVGHELLGYLASPLTSIAGDDKGESTLQDVIAKIKAIAQEKEFVNPAFDIYWPGEHTHPVKNADFSPSQVYLIDRSRASTHDFIIMLCASPSYGVGQENEIATQAGIPAIRLIPDKVSRMLTGSFLSATDIPYKGTLHDGICFNEDDFRQALSTIRHIYFRHRALYKGVNGNTFGERLRKLVDDRRGDYQGFASDLGVSLSYIQVMMTEPFAVANPSTRLLNRMGVLLGVSVAYLIGESEQVDPIWIESNASWHSWATKAAGDEVATAVQIRDEWRQQYTSNKTNETVASFRNVTTAMRESDWDKLYQQKIKKVVAGAGQLFQ